MAKSLNKVQLIGNMTRDPELRYTPAGTAVCTFSIATNRSWKTESGEMKDEAEFHRLVAWDKLAEICGKMLTKGKRIYVEGRIQSRKWTGQDGVEKTTVEIVISDMIMLERGAGEGMGSEAPDLSIPDDFDAPQAQSAPKTAKTKKEDKEPEVEAPVDDDIPF